MLGAVWTLGLIMLAGVLLAMPLLRSIPGLGAWIGFLALLAGLRALLPQVRRRW